MTTALDAARRYLADGLSVIPIPHGQKKPTLPAWQRLRLTADELPRHFTNGENIGVLLGAPSHGLVDVDLDSAEAVRMARTFLPNTAAIFGRAGKPRSHWSYVATGATTEQFKDPDGTMLVELRSTGAQTVFPPSIHPTGESITWSGEEGAPASVDAATLRRAVAKLASASLLARHWPTQGSRDNTAMALAGALLRGGWGVAATDEFIVAVADAAGDEEARSMRAKAVATQAKLDAGDDVTGWPRLRDVLGADVADRARTWLGLMSDAKTRDGAYAIAASAVERERVTFLDEDQRIPLRAVTVLAGLPGLGKSQETCRVAAANRGVTLMATAEDSLSAVVRPRLEAAGADLERVRFIQMRRDGVEDGLALPGDVDKLDGLVATYRANLVVIDPLMAHLPEKVNSWSDQSVRRALAPLHRLAEDRGCAVLVVAHLNKRKGDDPMMRVGGSIGIVAAARSLLLLARDPDDTDGERGSRRILAQVKSNYSQERASLTLTIEPFLLDPDGERIPTSRIVVTGTSDLMGHELLATDDHGKQKKGDAAIAFLVSLLSSGPMPHGEILEEARRARIAERTLERAATRIGVKKTRHSSGNASGTTTTWELAQSGPNAAAKEDRF